MTMSILGLYSHMWHDAPDLDDDHQEPDPIDGEALTVTGTLVWWSAPAAATDE